MANKPIANSQLLPLMVRVSYSLRVIDGIVSHLWLANTGQVFILSVDLFDEWTGRLVRRTSGNKTMVRSAIKDTIVECIAELEPVEESEVLQRSYVRVCEDTKVPYYSLA
jgi:hypothetical protein